MTFVTKKQQSAVQFGAHLSAHGFLQEFFFTSKNSEREEDSKLVETMRASQQLGVHAGAQLCGQGDGHLRVDVLCPTLDTSILLGQHFLGQKGLQEFSQSPMQD